jgi:hypothetical protein
LTLKKCCAPDVVESGAVFEREYGFISLKIVVSDVAVAAAVVRRTGDVGGDGGDSFISSVLGRIIGELMISSKELIFIIGSVGCLNCCCCSIITDENGSITRKII